MAGNKYVSVDANGFQTETVSIQSSAGVGDAGKIPALDATGLIDSSMMPVGIGADTVILECTENLTAGNFVNIYDVTGTTKCRKADASGGVAKKADGFVLSAYTSGQNATVYLEGKNTQCSALVGGTIYFLSGSVAGTPTATVPTTAGYIRQILGKAVSATAINTEIDEPIIRA